MKLTFCSYTRFALAAAMMTGLAACSVSPTPYQLEGEGGGYSEQQIEDDRYSIKFIGNKATPRNTVEEYALFRAAEVTLENGHDYFKIVSREIEPIAGSTSGFFPSIGIGLGGRNVGVGVSTGIGGGGRTDFSYAAYLDIVVHDGDKPKDDRDAYVALDVVDNLKAKVAANTPTEEE